jgi:hypothetical protein
VGRLKVPKNLSRSKKFRIYRTNSDVRKIYSPPHPNGVIRKATLICVKELKITLGKLEEINHLVPVHREKPSPFAKGRGQGEGFYRKLNNYFGLELFINL